MSVATEVIRRRICDVCGSADGVEKVRITMLDASGDARKTWTRTVDLCTKQEDGSPGHVTPIREAVTSRDTVRPGTLRKSRKQRNSSRS